MADKLIMVNSGFWLRVLWLWLKYNHCQLVFVFMTTCFFTYVLWPRSGGTVYQTYSWQKTHFTNENREERGQKKPYFSHSESMWDLRMSIQFHAPLAYLRWHAMKSVQLWDSRGKVFWSLLRYVLVVASPPPDRLRHYVAVTEGSVQASIGKMF